jgi:hypothetical protein
MADDPKTANLFGEQGPLLLGRDARGRRKHLPRAQERIAAETLAGYGISQDEIALVLGVAPKTLRDRYRDDLDRGTARANAAVAQNLYRKATGDSRESVTAAMFWLRCRAGWSEFSPAPARPQHETPLGRKDAAELAAETADEGTGWHGLLH